MDTTELRRLLSEATALPWRRSAAHNTIRLKSDTRAYAIVVCDRVREADHEADGVALAACTGVAREGKASFEIKEGLLASRAGQGENLLYDVLAPCKHLAPVFVHRPHPR